MENENPLTAINIAVIASCNNACSTRCNSDEYGARAPSTLVEDKFKVWWLGVVDGKGIITDTVTGSWHKRCARPGRGRRALVHAYDE
eukprot:882889-Pleurochrysis_carterae.AAC.1